MSQIASAFNSSHSSVVELSLFETDSTSVVGSNPGGADNFMIEWLELLSVMYEQHTLGEWVIFADNRRQQEQQKQISVTGGNYGSQGSINGGSGGI